MADTCEYQINRKIAIATSTRADWGLLSPIATSLSSVDGVDVKILATNMHLDKLRGYTVNEIIADGFEPAARIEMSPADDSPRETARAMARCLSGMADALADINPDELIILGDRYEMLAVASAATLLRIPIIHIAGGEVSEGAIDDSIRHAITKLSSLHLTATEAYRKRVIQMGENPANVINTGAIGVYNILSLPLMNKAELEDSIGFPLNKSTLLVTIHPATASDEDVERTPKALFDALNNRKDLKAIITYPNNDSKGSRIIKLIDEYAKENPDRIHIIPSLGRLRYLSALQFVGAVVGNSSSGIVEVPSMKIPTVNIGPRQKGRIAGSSVINCGETIGEIIEAIDFALSEEGVRLAVESDNPYYQPDTLLKMTEAILSHDPSELRNKSFYNIKF